MQYLSKPMLLAVLTVFGAALAIAPAHAQSGSRALANIPFDFSVGKTTLKAGSYSVEQLQSGILALSSSDNKEHQFALTFPSDSDHQSQESHLVFIRYESEVFLKKVSLSGNENSYELPESRRERDSLEIKYLVPSFLCSSRQYADCGDTALAEWFAKPHYKVPIDSPAMRPGRNVPCGDEIVTETARKQP